MPFSNSIFDKYTSVYTIDKSRKHDTITFLPLDDGLYEVNITISGVRRSSVKTLDMIKMTLPDALETMTDALLGNELTMDSIKPRLKLRRGIDILFGDNNVTK
jgi:hypothetical protein